MAEKLGLMPLVEALLNESEWEESYFGALERNMLEYDQLMGHSGVEPKKSSDLTADVKKRIEEVLPLFIRADENAVQFIHVKVQQYLDSVDRSSDEEAYLKTWAALIANVADAYRTLRVSQRSFRDQIATFASGFPIDGEHLDTINSTLYAFNEGAEMNQYAEKLIGELADQLSALVPSGTRLGNEALSKRLRGRNPAVLLGEMLAVVFVASGRDIEDATAGFRNAFARVFQVLEPELPDEKRLFGEIERRIRKRRGMLKATPVK